MVKDFIIKTKAEAKDLTLEAKDLTIKTKAKAKDLSFKAKAGNMIHEAKVRAIQNTSVVITNS